MTDSSTLVPNVMGISSDCQYNLKPSAVRSRAYRASIAPTNKASFNPQDVIIAYVPGGRRNTYLDTAQSYMKFTVKNNDTTSATSTKNSLFYTDNNAGCFFNRLDLFHASNLLETVQSYNQLMTIFMDTNMNSSQKLGLSCAFGTATTMPGSSVVDNSRQGAPIFGTVWTTGGTASTNTCAQQQTFCLPILSGTIGLGAEKFLPLGKLTDDIRLEFTLESQNTAVVYINAATNNVPSAGWTIIDFQLELAIVELSDEGQAMVDSYISPEMPIYIHSTSYRSYTSNLPSGQAGGISYLVPARFGSLRSLFVCPRRAAESSTTATVANSYSLSSRINPNFGQYWWRVGSALLPSKYVVLDGTTVGGYAEAFMELQKAFHSVSSPDNASVLPASIYNVSDVGTIALDTANIVPSLYKTSVGSAKTTTASYQNGFLIGQELESFALRSDVLLSGYNTLSQQIFFEAQISADTTAAYTLNFFAMFDQIIVIENGIMSVRF